MSLAEDFARVSRFGAGEGGAVDRQAATAADGDQRRWLCERLAGAGARIVVDPIGNIFGLFTWTDGADWVMCGSHLDSQPNGGRYDGAYGVVAALNAAEELDARVRSGNLTPVRNLAVVDWTNEEGARFQPSVMGSSVHCGFLPLEDALGSTDASGVTLRQALSGIGFLGNEEFTGTAVRYAEIHVEQGDRMEREALDVAAVSANWAAGKYDIRITGEQGHTGSTPMAQRRDALVGLARIVAAVDDFARHHDEQFHASATDVVTFPHSPNVVTSVATAHIELRSADLNTVLRAEEWLEELLSTVADEYGLEIDVVQRSARESSAFWPEGVELTRSVAQSLGFTAGELCTIAGHDAVVVARTMPTVLMFVPSCGGHAHSPREYTPPSDLEKGLATLTGVLAELTAGY